MSGKSEQRIRKIYEFFSDKRRVQLKKDFNAHFGLHWQTFYNKLNPNKPKSQFYPEEIVWLETWAKKNGMPDDYLNEEKENGEPVTA